MKKEPIKYGMIGFGGIAENRIAKEGFAIDHARFSPLKEARLVGATDINPQRRSAVEQLGLKWYSDISAMLADPDIEAVFIASNNLTHASTAKTALRAGRHAIVEKPIASKREDAVELVEMARAKKLSLTVDHMMTENVYNAKARDMVMDNALGTVNDVCLHMEFLYGDTASEAQSWRCANPRELGGPIGDMGSHCLYMAEYILGSRIVQLGCVYYPKTMKTAVEDGAYIKFRVGTGVSGSIRVAFCEPRGSLEATLNNFGYEIYGTKGVISGYATLFQLSGHQDEPVEVRLEMDKSGERNELPVEKPQNIYQSVIRRHARSIANQSPMDAGDGLHNLSLIEACYRSANNAGQTLKIDRNN